MFIFMCNDVITEHFLTFSPCRFYKLLHFMKLQMDLLNDNTLQDSSETLVVHQINNIKNCGKTVIRNNKQLSNSCTFQCDLYFLMVFSNSGPATLPSL